MQKLNNKTILILLVLVGVVLVTAFSSGRPSNHVDEIAVDAPVPEVTQESIAIGAPTGNEMANERSYTAKKYDNGDGTFTLEAHIGHIHYKDGNGNFLDSNITWSESAQAFAMTEHNYELTVKKRFNANGLILYHNKWEGNNHNIGYSPESLVWVDTTNPENAPQLVASAQNVQAVQNGNTLYWTGAFGAGIDFEVTLLRSGFTKEVVFTQNPNLIPPSPDHKLMAIFTYTGTGLDVKNREDAQLWNKLSYIEGNDWFEIEETANAGKRSLIRPAYIYDSSLRGNRQLINVIWANWGNKLYQAKEIPLDFFATAEYPVKADTTTSYYSGAQDGDLTGGAGTFSTVRGQANANFIDAVDNDGNAYADNASYIRRLYYPINTSGIGSGATINHATLTLTHVGGVELDSNNGSIGVLEGNMTDSNPLQVSDFPVASYTDLAARVDITTINNQANNTQVDFVFNATGRGVINTTGTTSLITTTSFDIDGTPTPTGGNATDFYFTEETTGGNTYDPFLEVTYTAAGGGGGGGGTANKQDVIWFE